MTGEEFYNLASKNRENIKPFITVFSYKDPLVKTAIWSLKYRRNRKMANLLAEAICPSLNEILENENLFDNFSNPLFLPIPANKDKKRERGFDQAVLLGQKIFEKMPKNFFEYQPNYLKRIKKTPNQAGLRNRNQRFENLKNSLSANKRTRNRNIIVFDDVMTTGATFKEAERALKSAGAKKIIFFSLAH